MLCGEPTIGSTVQRTLLIFTEKMYIQKQLIPKRESVVFTAICAY